MNISCKNQTYSTEFNCFMLIVAYLKKRHVGVDIFALSAFNHLTVSSSVLASKTIIMPANVKPSGFEKVQGYIFQ